MAATTPKIVKTVVTRVIFISRIVIESAVIYKKTVSRYIIQ